MRLVALAMFAGLLLAIACSDSEPLDSGIEGHVLAGPQCPVVQQGSPCPDKPLQATVDVYDTARTHKVATFTSDADGSFKVDLEAGEYYLDPLPLEPGNPFPVPGPQEVTVRERAYTNVIISYDTGIR